MHASSDLWLFFAMDLLEPKACTSRLRSLVCGAVALFAVTAKRWTGDAPQPKRGTARGVGTALLAGALMSLAFAWPGAYAHAQPQEIAMKTSPVTQSTRADFDFLIGRWHVTHRRLKERLIGSHEWVEFAGTTIAQKTLGGLGNMDDNVLELPGGTYHAMTVRAFDVETRQWSIWWLDSRQPRTIDTPVVGRFEDGVGTFYADDILGGRPVRVRFVWTLPKPDQPRWEQAFSTDGGVTWEINWVMDFTRIR